MQSNVYQKNHPNTGVKQILDLRSSNVSNEQSWGSPDHLKSVLKRQHKAGEFVGLNVKLYVPKQGLYNNEKAHTTLQYNMVWNNNVRLSHFNTHKRLTHINTKSINNNTGRHATAA